MRKLLDLSGHGLALPPTPPPPPKGATRWATTLLAAWYLQHLLDVLLPLHLRYPVHVPLEHFDEVPEMREKRAEGSAGLVLREMPTSRFPAPPGGRSSHPRPPSPSSLHVPTARGCTCARPPPPGAAERKATRCRRRCPGPAQPAGPAAPDALRGARRHRSKGAGQARAWPRRGHLPPGIPSPATMETLHDTLCRRKRGHGRAEAARPTSGRAPRMHRARLPGPGASI